MGRDILILGGATLVIGIVTWMVWGNPSMNGEPRLPRAQSLNQSSDLQLISEASPYMRDER
jgi:hypothetical protein